MKKEFIPYEQALALKELGFDEPCLGYYTGDTMHFVLRPLMLRANELASYVVTAPLFQQGFRWFREKYGLWNMIYPRDGWNYVIQGIDETISCTGESFHNVEIKSYEEAELECLKKLIEIVNG
jgi:hypothetical protein